MIAIIDYGMGNIHSVNKALVVYGAETLVTNKPEDILSCEKVVLPGVGAFDDAMQELENQGLIPVLRESIKNKKPFLGICLGMQLLFEGSEEAKSSKGLGVFKGMVKKFEAAKDLKVPHMGWNQINIGSKGQRVKGSECPLLEGISDGAFLYFCHSYYPDPKNKEVIAATCNYGKDFACAVWRDFVYGVQFHPEKSQTVGLKMLENFVKLC
jgi:glutamine amidotransferase